MIRIYAVKKDADVLANVTSTLAYFWKQEYELKRVFSLLVGQVSEKVYKFEYLRARKREIEEINKECCI